MATANLRIWRSKCELLIFERGEGAIYSDRIGSAAERRLVMSAFAFNMAPLGLSDDRLDDGAKCSRVDVSRRTTRSERLLSARRSSA